jgi:hypothetical protein
VVVWRYSPDVLEVDVDATNFASFPFNSAAPITLDMLIVGASTDLPTQLFKGDLSELVVVPSRITDAQVDQFRTYAHENWGTPL